MNRIFSMKITALCIIRFQNFICLWQLTFGWLMHSFYSSDVCFLSSLVNYNTFPLASLIWLPIRIIDLAWYSQGAQSCCELRWGKKKKKETFSEPQSQYLENSSLQLGNNDCFAGRMNYPLLGMFFQHRLAQFSYDTDASVTFQWNLNTDQRH